MGYIENKATEWEAQWCSNEPSFELPPVHSSFNPTLLTVRSADVTEPWKNFPSGSRTELINCRMIFRIK